MHPPTPTPRKEEGAAVMAAPSVEMTTTRFGGRFSRKAGRYSLKPVNDSMRPPHVLLLSDSNPYSPKVNSMM